MVWDIYGPSLVMIQEELWPICVLYGVDVDYRHINLIDISLPCAIATLLSNAKDRLCISPSFWFVNGMGVPHGNTIQSSIKNDGPRYFSFIFRVKSLV